MRYYFSLLLALICWSCASDKQEMTEYVLGNSKTYSFSVDATLSDINIEDNTESTRASAESVIRLTWATDDALSVVNLTKGIVLGGQLKATAKGDRATFTGTLSGTIDDTDKLAFIYPSIGNSSVQSFTGYEFDYSRQDGSSKVPFCAYKVVSASDLNRSGSSFSASSLSLGFLMAYIRMNLSDLPKNTIIKKIEIENLGTTLNLAINSTKDDFEKTSTTGKITLTPTNLKATDKGYQLVYITCAESAAQSARRKINVYTDDKKYTSDMASSAFPFLRNLNTIINCFEEAELDVPNEDEDGISYITFSAEAEQTLSMSDAVPDLEYSVNNGTWTTLTTTTVTFGGSKGNLRLRGKYPYGTASDQNNYSQIIFGYDTPVLCSGDIRTLLDYENYTTVSTENAKFCSLFKDCYQLTSAPKLPATSVYYYCYESMFKGCTSLTETPDLPATKLGTACYKQMFSGCTSLTKAPILPATTVTSGGYEEMFRDCTSLTEAPELPATTLYSVCYSGMFWGCTSLTEAPELPATSAPKRCYEYMFSGCTSLTKAPELPATTLGEQCYKYMFYGCTSLSKGPSVLPAMKIAALCYQGMFQGCTSLTVAPDLPATTLDGSCYKYMFKNCTSLTESPYLPALKVYAYSYEEMFSGCTNLSCIMMMATDINYNDCLLNWTKDVASYGKFIMNSKASWTIRGVSGIPSGWTVQVW